MTVGIVVAIGAAFAAPALDRVNKRGTTTLTRGAARNTLDHYRYNFTSF